MRLPRTRRWLVAALALPLLLAGVPAARSSLAGPAATPPRPTPPPPPAHALPLPTFTPSSVRPPTAVADFSTVPRPSPTTSTTARLQAPLPPQELVVPADVLYETPTPSPRVAAPIPAASRPDSAQATAKRTVSPEFGTPPPAPSPAHAAALAPQGGTPPVPPPPPTPPAH